MLGLVVGLIVGAAVAGPLGYALARRELTRALSDLAFLRARLRSLTTLAHAGVLKPDTIEAANVLNDLTDLAARDGTSVQGVETVAVPTPRTVDRKTSDYEPPTDEVDLRVQRMPAVPAPPDSIPEAGWEEEDDWAEDEVRPLIPRSS